jgi:hypothetical protein
MIFGQNLAILMQQIFVGKYWVKGLKKSPLCTEGQQVGDFKLYEITEVKVITVEIIKETV